jgi:uroporphyrinogen-III decarboxylase
LLQRASRCCCFRAAPQAASFNVLPGCGWLCKSSIGANAAGTGKLANIREGCTANVVGLDWHVDMSVAREAFGAQTVLQGNVDPTVLFGSEAVIRENVTRCLRQAGAAHHILNVGHGVVQGTPEENVGLFCQLARESASVFGEALVEQQ